MEGLAQLFVFCVVAIAVTLMASLVWIIYSFAPKDKNGKPETQAEERNGEGYAKTKMPPRGLYKIMGMVCITIVSLVVSYILFIILVKWPVHILFIGSPIAEGMTNKKLLAHVLLSIVPVIAAWRLFLALKKNLR